MNSTWLCRLCLQQSTDVVNIFDNFEDTTVSSILTQHFWFQISEGDGLSQCLCHICWTNTKTFHIFYKTVELVQNEVHHNLMNAVEIDFCPDFIKEERNETPIETSFEIDLDIVKREETKPLTILETNEGQTFEFDGDLKCDQSKHVPTTSEENYNYRPPEAKQTKKLLKATNLLSRKKSKSKTKQKSIKFKTCHKTASEDAQIFEYFKMSCELCGDPFETYRSVRKHYRAVHKVRGYLICCGRKFDRRGRVLSHINFHLNPDIFSCNQCGRRCSDETALSAHIENHEPLSSRAFKCDQCPKRFTRECGLMNHKEFVHCPVKCVECDVSYPSQSKLATHMKNVHQSKGTTTMRMCDICGKELSNKNNLLNHMREVHSAIEGPKFQCDICGAWPKTKRSLRRHLGWHMEKPVKCSVCSRMLRTKSSLASHMRYVHVERRYRCSICDKKFKNRLILKEHIAVHTGQDLYDCPYCSKTFKSSANMYSHRKKMHLAEWTQDCSKGSATVKKKSSI